MLVNTCVSLRHNTQPNDETYITGDNSADSCAYKQYAEHKTNRSSTFLEFKEQYAYDRIQNIRNDKLKMWLT